MSNRNATASWSGFSHQGQVGLLVALREMRKIKEDDYPSYYVDFENREDVSIYKISGSKPKILSVHQVKAYYSDRNNQKNKYKDVLNNPFDACGNDFLHTVVEIDDWKTSTTKYANSIKRFPYDKNIYHCDTTDIDKFIKKELKHFIGKNEAKMELAFNRIVYELDLKIRTEHKKKSKKLFDIKFSFHELNEYINDDQIIKKNNLFISRKFFYQMYVQAIKNDALDENRLDYIEKNIIIPIYEHLSDEKFLSFLKHLNLNSSKMAIDYPHGNYNEMGFKDVFYPALIEIIGVDPQLFDNSVKYIKNTESFVLTTINQGGSIKDVVKNIIENLEDMDILWDNHSLINEHHNGSLTPNNPSIKRNIGQIDDNIHEDKYKINHPKENRLITKTNTINLLNDE